MILIKDLKMKLRIVTKNMQSIQQISVLYCFSRNQFHDLTSSQGPNASVVVNVRGFNYRSYLEAVQQFHKSHFGFSHDRVGLFGVLHLNSSNFFGFINFY